jgi:ubiquinone/menaquinone biosynthesis C-methylase UbiE
MDGEMVRDLVRSGYDRVADDFLAVRVIDGADSAQLDILQSSLDPASQILDAGCGCGVPVAKTLTKAAHRVIGLDLSAGQLRLARRQTTGLEPVQADLADLPFRDQSFDALVSFYAVIHVPREEHLAVLKEFRRVLRPGGRLLVCMGWKDLPADLDPESWLGAPMFWSHYEASVNLELFKSAGVVVANAAEVPDPNGHGSHQFVLAVNP